MSDQVPEPLTLDAALRDTAKQNVSLFQICDHGPLTDAGDHRLDEIAELAQMLGLELEVGTRGTSQDHLTRYLHIAERLGAGLVRSMWTAGDDRPHVHETKHRLRSVLPRYESSGITLALETYEQVSSATLVDVIATLDSAYLGICLDPANTVANLEHPDNVTHRCAPYVKNWHVKDFDFTRSPDGVGFSYTGVPLGTGRLNYDGIRDTIHPAQHGISQIIEFWLPWQRDGAATADAEAEWTDLALTYIRS